jgi:hypothetical protein
MTKMRTIPENYDNIRAGIVELLAKARAMGNLQTRIEGGSAYKNSRVVLANPE